MPCDRVRRRNANKAKQVMSVVAPVAGAHVEVVLAQVSMPEHVPSLQVSFSVQASPSLHVAVLFV